VKFYKDLCADIHHLTASSLPGYMDRQELPLGADWPADLTRALSTCRVFMPIYSPRYFNSEYCGKEWTVFARRVERHARGGSPPAVIIPVVWTDMDLEDIPEFARLVQYSQGGLPSHYVREGLYGIMRLGKYREAYKETVFCLAKAVIAAAKIGLAPLHESEQIRLDQIPDAFADAKRPSDSLDIRLTVAACDLSSLPAERDRFYYGPKPLRWTPYRPTEDKPVADVAETVIRGMGHRAELKELGAGPEEATRPDVMLVDMWAADQVRLAEDLGKAKGQSTVVILPVDQGDEESIQHRERLETSLKSLIGPALLRKGSRRAVPHEKFQESLVQAVNTAIRHHLRTVKVRNAPPAQRKPSLEGFEPGGHSH